MAGSAAEVAGLVARPLPLGELAHVVRSVSALFSQTIALLSTSVPSLPSPNELRSLAQDVGCRRRCPYVSPPSLRVLRCAPAMLSLTPPRVHRGSVDPARRGPVAVGASPPGRPPIPPKAGDKEQITYMIH